MSEQLLALLGGAVVATGLGALAIVVDYPLGLALAATVAFVSVGYVMPARGLPLVIARRQLKPAGAARAALLFAVLGIALVWASTTALDPPLPSMQVLGWLELACFCVLGANFVAALRCADATNAGRAEEPRP